MFFIYVHEKLIIFEIKTIHTNLTRGQQQQQQNKTNENNYYYTNIPSAISSCSDVYSITVIGYHVLLLL
jgi:hypothetical protein